MDESGAKGERKGRGAIALFEMITISWDTICRIDIHLSFNLSIVDNAGKMSNYINLRLTVTL